MSVDGSLPLCAGPSWDSNPECRIADGWIDGIMSVYKLIMGGVQRANLRLKLKIRGRKKGANT